MRHLPVETAVRATVECHQQQGTGLRRLYHREHTSHRGKQAHELIFLAQQLVGRKERRVNLATHHVRLRTKGTVGSQHLTGKTSIILRYTAGGVVTTQGIVQALPQAVVVKALLV